VQPRDLAVEEPVVVLLDRSEGVVLEGLERFTERSPPGT